MFLKKFYKNSHFNPIPHLNGEERQKKRYGKEKHGPY
jgi:hypothetical protein